MIPVARPVIGDEEIEAAIRVLKSGMYTAGREVANFEEKFAEYIGTRYAVVCNSGIAALHLALQAYFFDDDFEVIVPSMSFFATVSSVIIAGGKPIFVDVDDRCNMDPKDVEDKITSRTAAIIPVHLYGHPCQISEILTIARKHNLKVIEDCAQSHGAMYNYIKTGSFGDVGCFSFFATKNMTTLEGGMITTDDEKIYDVCKCLVSHGMKDRNTHLFVGYNYRMNELSAAIGRIQLKKLDMFNNKRIENSMLLLSHLDDKEWFKFYYPEEKTKDVYFWFPMYCEYPTEFSNYLKKNEIGFRFRYHQPLYKQVCLPSEYSQVFCPNAEKLSGKMFGLPNYPGLDKQELERVIDVVNSFRP